MRDRGVAQVILTCTKDQEKTVKQVKLFLVSFFFTSFSNISSSKPQILIALKVSKVYCLGLINVSLLYKYSSHSPLILSIILLLFS